MKEIVLLQSLYKKSCKTVNGRLKGGFVNHDDPVNKAIDLAISALEAQKESKGVEIDQFRNGWIPVSKQLPEMGNDYLVTMQEDNVFQGKPFVNWASFDGEFFYDSTDGTIFNNVIAWMPLPEPYDALAEKIQVVLDREHRRISGKEN